MSKKSSIYIDVNSNNVSVAMTEDDELVEFYIESSSQKKLVGNIYKGVVVNVLAGMQAAFVDIGLERNAFMYVGDMIIDRAELQNHEIDIPEKLSIAPGDEIMVQVVKDEVGTKGARISCNISLPGRSVVMTPTLDFFGVSRKITDEKIKQKLMKIVKDHAAEGCGYIIRTVAPEMSKKEIVAEMKQLSKLWESIQERYKKARPRELIYTEGDLVARMVRDMLNSNVEHIITNSKEAYNTISEHLVKSLAVCADKLELYTGKIDMFKYYGIRQKIDKLLDRKVWLKSGGYLIIDKTEALTVIDVNSGKYTGESNLLEDTVFKVNLEAAQEIARQLRLRNIGGIVIIDFIDMELNEHKQKVLEVLEEALKRDRTKCKLLGMTQLGLVELTRKKVRNDISSCLQDECTICHGSGRILSTAAVADKIRTDLLDLFATMDPPAATITVNPDVMAKMFTGIFSKECETIWAGKRIYVIPDEHLLRDVYRIQVHKDKILTLPNNAKLLY
ncbi:MAG TPA: Rne/Rng family ribonuclease [Clostridia bacterium]